MAYALGVGFQLEFEDESNTEKLEEQKAANRKIAETLKKRSRLNENQNAPKEVPSRSDDMIPAESRLWLLGDTPKSKRSRLEEKDQPPWFQQGRPTNGMARLHEELIDFSHWAEPSEAEIIDRLQTCGRIIAIARGLWPQCKGEVFGSCWTGLDLPNSDCDLAIL
eukprot:Platyproteum_vivax@DN5620_c0_g1_i4.p1